MMLMMFIFLVRCLNEIESSRQSEEILNVGISFFAYLVYAETIYLFSLQLQLQLQ